jgi:hypothetical protein
MSTLPLLEDDNGETVACTPEGAGRERKWHHFFNSLVAKAPTNGARVAESLDYEPVQNNLYFERLKARKGKRHYYGCETAPSITCKSFNFLSLFRMLVRSASGSVVANFRARVVALNALASQPTSAAIQALQVLRPHVC